MRTAGSDDLVALVEYLGANNPYSPVLESPDHAIP